MSISMTTGNRTSIGVEGRTLATSAYAAQKQKTDKPKDVVVKSDLKKGYIEVFVYADKK